MALIQEKDRTEIKKLFAALDKPVKIVHFTQEFECEFCRETRQLMEEVAGLSEKLSLETYDFVRDKTVVERYRIDRIPATVLLGEKDSRVRFFGIPSGYEFISLLEGIRMVSKGDSELQDDSRKKLAALSKPVHVQVFVTPT
jgi:glutaredoxin-like protein